MNCQNHITGYFIIFFLALFLWIPINAEAATTGTYSVSAVAVKKFKKSGSYLTVTAKERFYKGRKKPAGKKIHFKVSKKCKWRYKNLGIRFPQNKGIRKENYKTIRKLVYQAKGLPENGYYTLSITVKNKRIIKVVFQCV